jgi:hypothetical protein
MWNLPIGQWPQFFGALNLMMQMPVGQFAGMQQSSNNNSCAGGQGAVQAPQPQQPVQAGGKNKKKGQAQSADAARKVNNKPDQQLSAGGVLDPKFKDVICYNCGEPGHYVGYALGRKDASSVVNLAIIWTTVQCGTHRCLQPSTGGVQTLV